MNEHARSNATTAAISGGVLLVYGYLFGITVYADHGPFYSFLIHLFNWTVRLGGVGLLATAAVCAMGNGFGLMLDAAISALCGGIMLLCVVGWCYYEKTIDIYGLAAGLFALMLLREGYAAGALYIRTREDSGRKGDRPAPASVPTIVISSKILPKADSPPPAEGYLAALAKEEDDDSLGATHE